MINCPVSKLLASISVPVNSKQVHQITEHFMVFREYSHPHDFCVSLKFIPFPLQSTPWSCQINVDVLPTISVSECMMYLQSFQILPNFRNMYLWTSNDVTSLLIPANLLFIFIDYPTVHGSATMDSENSRVLGLKSKIM